MVDRFRKRWRIFTLSAVAAVAALAVAIPAVFGADPIVGVKAAGIFELDGNTLASPQGSCTQPTDWSALYLANTATACGSDGFKFINDGTGAADNTYWSQGGSKDAYDPALGPWLTKSNDVSPDKNDLVNAFSAAYTKDGNQYLYFGADRFNTNGDAQMGFWFLRSKACIAGAGGDEGCPLATPDQVANAGKFVDPTTGIPIHHQDGDILALVNYNNGGAIGLAAVFEWQGADGNGGGSAQQVLVGSGADCPTATDTAGNPLKFCATANKTDLANEPIWPYQAKGGGSSYVASAFVEGAINLSAINGAGRCFPTFLAETRSSGGPSSGLGLTAQLKDLAFGQFQLCGSSTVTTPKDGSGATIPTPPSPAEQIPTISLGAGNAGVNVKDSALITVNGVPTFSGTVKFFLCGPTATTPATGCTSSTAPQIGTTQTLTDATSPQTVVSASANLTKAGYYCWRAEYSGDSASGVPSSKDDSTGECFKVTPVTPTLSTQAINSTGGNQTTAVAFGSTIYDKATLSGTANGPGTGGVGSDNSINGTNRPGAGGTITFKLYGPDDPSTQAQENCTTLAAGFATAHPNGIEVTVNGDGTYGVVGGAATVGFQPQAPGTYFWKAQYSGDSPNTNGTTQHNAACDQTAEAVTVLQLQPTMDTAQRFVPNDSATVTVGNGAGNLAGTVKFRLYVNAADCTGTPDYTSGDINIDSGTPNAGTAGQTKTVSSSNTTAYSASATFLWKVTFTSTNSGHKNVTSNCTENSSIAIDNGAQANTP